MKLSVYLLFVLVCGSGAVHAGSRVSPPAEKVVVDEGAPVHTLFPETPLGLVTVGGMWSEHASGVFADSITGLWAPKERDAFLFLDSRYHYEDDSQFIQSTGMGFRKLFREQKIIVGVNAYYDQINSQHDNDFNQAGFGAEVLSQWVDARFNYYLPEDSRQEVGRSTRVDRSVGFGPGGVTETTRRRQYRRFEAPLEGLNLEVGFLVPGLEKLTEVRVFGGFHHYRNPFGSDFDGFQGRLEARLLPGLIADVEYWDDARLMGGHWTVGLRASVPFSLIALARGHNPFVGAADEFRPRVRDFDERLSEMVIRSHRIQTTTSGDVLTGTRVTARTFPPPPVVKPAPAPPSMVVVPPVFTSADGGSSFGDGAGISIIAVGSRSGSAP